MMNVCFVLPNYGPNMVNDPCCFPLGVMYASSFMKSLGYEVKVLNFNIFNYDLKEEFKNQDVVALTGYDQFLSDNVEIRDIAHDMGIKTMLGGAMATFNKPAMKKLFDGVFRGEIEGDAPIDNIPWPDYEGFGIDEYNCRHSVRYMGVMTSRGCPFSCTFCSQTCKFRERDLGGVAEEIEAYKSKYEVEYIVFNDNTINVTKKRFLEVCNMARSAKVAWSAAIRADVFDEDMAIAAKNSGCQYFVVGVESFRQDRLDGMNKYLKVEQIRNTLDLLHKHGIDYHGNIILGLENETVSDITQEIEELPKGYKLFPVLAQSFAGTNVKSDLTDLERGSLNMIFSEYAKSKGKYAYEGVA